ncbi:hypothetical protein Tco_0924096 [Tanacetum coccineum]|uniref:Uncharacterized protein n=1 Tax=Tanacetum coccineum TaxID=301880 RepID=A0ABQ5D5K8_9ASTR
MRPLRMAYRRVVAFDLLRDALSAIFGLSELKAWDARDALGYILDCTLKDLVLLVRHIGTVQNHDESNVYDNVRRHSEQPESINDTYVLEKDDSNVTLDSSNICTNDNQADQHAVECVDERDALANLTLNTEENKTILKANQDSKRNIDSKNWKSAN